ncbi:LOW QUALITY PROTEIN: microtubule-associated protein 1 light chain 3 gamma [Pterocles gutturalis]
MPGVPAARPFKLRKSFATRLEEVAGIRAKFPTKIPVIVERYHKEKYLPLLDKTKFLVPEELTMTQFITIIRSRMALTATQAFYLLVNNKSLASMSWTMQSVQRLQREDGFVYMTYASQEMFGCLPTAQVETMECPKNLRLGLCAAVKQCAMNHACDMNLGRCSFQYWALELCSGEL